MSNEAQPAKRATLLLDSANADLRYPAYQISINAMDGEHSGHGYRLMGPKYMGRSTSLRKVNLTSYDADEIRGILDEVFPQTVKQEKARAAWYREAAKLLEEAGYDDDAVNLLYNVATGIDGYAEAEAAA